MLILKHTGLKMISYHFLMRILMIYMRLWLLFKFYGQCGYNNVCSGALGALIAF